MSLFYAEPGGPARRQLASRGWIQLLCWAGVMRVAGGYSGALRGAFSAACAALCLAACSTNVGKIVQSNGAEVSLRENNYKIVRASAVGSSTGFALFGVLTLVSPTYSEAKQELYRSVGQKLEGRAIALTNQTEDRSVVNFLLFSIPKITLTADVIEFNAGVSAAPPKLAR
jgi:hypothetical protein